jgi:hypothetical protein
LRQRETISIGVEVISIEAERDHLDWGRGYLDWDRPSRLGQRPSRFRSLAVQTSPQVEYLHSNSLNIIFILGEVFLNANFEVFAAVMFQVEVLWVVMPCVAEVLGASIFREKCGPL